MSQNPYAAPLSHEVDSSDWNPSFDGSKFATRWQRFAGNFVDYTLVIFVLIPIAVIVFLIFPQLAEGTNSITTDVIETIVIIVIMFVVFVLLNSYLLASRGQTVGKFLLKTQILSEDNELVPVVRILVIRYLLTMTISALPGIGNLFSLANAAAIFRENHKCIHDDFCKTKVVKYEPVYGNTPVEKY